MNLAQALQTSARTLYLNDTEDSYHEARILLQHILNLSSTKLYTQPELLLSFDEISQLQQLVERRLRREPNAYLSRHKEFFGIDFYVDHRVLIPRPETELLVEEALAFATRRSNQLRYSKQPLRIADVGTGCGAIAISLALSLPQSKIYATDISPAALEVAILNCEHHNVSGQVHLLQGDLLEPLPEPVDLLIANLPYVKSSDLPHLSPEIANFEPEIALDGGEDGLKYIHRLIAQARGIIAPQSCILLEIGAKQADIVVGIIERHLPEAHYELAPDLNGIERVVNITL